LHTNLNARMYSKVFVSDEEMDAYREVEEEKIDEHYRMRERIITPIAAANYQWQWVGPPQKETS
jgi:hypothetical protein